MATAYCVKCRQKREIKDPRQIIMTNGKLAAQGTCPVCGTTLLAPVAEEEEEEVWWPEVE